MATEFMERKRRDGRTSMNDGGVGGGIPISFFGEKLVNSSLIQR
jgi:hypothetical protein